MSFPPFSGWDKLPTLPLRVSVDIRYIDIPENAEKKKTNPFVQIDYLLIS